MRQATAQSVRISEKESLEWSSSEPGAPAKSPQDLERLAHWLDTIFGPAADPWRSPRRGDSSWLDCVATLRSQDEPTLDSKVDRNCL
jgi:hypothetical protein